MSIGPFQLLIVLILIALLFGTKKIRNIGSDLGAAIKGFKNEMDKDKPQLTQQESKVIEGEVVKERKDTV